MLPKNLKRIREHKKIGINELGRLTGLSPSYLSALERGTKSNLSLDTLEKIADALGVSIDRLTGESASSIIEERLEEMGMTLPELATKANVPHATVTKRLSLKHLKPLQESEKFHC